MSRLPRILVGALPRWVAALILLTSIPSGLIAQEEPPVKAAKPRYQWAGPTRVASACCTEFSGLSDLPLSAESVTLLKRSLEELGPGTEALDEWSNGSAQEFLAWTSRLAEKGKTDTTLILFLCTHQLKDAQLRFTEGPNMEGARFIEAMNHLGGRYERVLLLNDSCFAAGLERKGTFATNVIRFYSASGDEASVDLNFDKGAYGLEEFVEKERTWVREAWRWEPRGMGFFATMSLKILNRWRQEPSAGVDLQRFFNAFTRYRNQYNDEIRQARAQHPKLVPSDANFVILQPTADPPKSGETSP